MSSSRKALSMMRVLLLVVKFDPAIAIDVDPEVYNPSDDSFLMLKTVEVHPGETLLEMGPGSGIISVHAAKAGAKVTAADVNPYAVECTRRNALKNDTKVEVVKSDLFENVEGLFDVIVFNPPYLADEATSTSWIERSWTGGKEGSEVAIRFMEDVWKHLAPNGRVYMILSSLGGLTNILKASRERFQAEVLEEKHMFFESMFAYRFVLKSSTA